MSIRKAERRQPREASPAHVPSNRVLTFRAWCSLNAISIATGRRLIAAGKVKVTQLSARRIGIREDHNAEYQSACIRIGE
jgi:hypothetical protein